MHDRFRKSVSADFSKTLQPQNKVLVFILTKNFLQIFFLEKINDRRQEIN